MNPSKKSEAVPWRLSDPLWRRVEIVLDSLDPPKTTGRPRADRRLLLEGILYRLRTGIQWRRLPSGYGDDSTVHRTFHRWDEQGTFEKMWDLLIEEHPELRDVSWKWEPPPGTLRRLRLKQAQ